MQVQQAFVLVPTPTLLTQVVFHNRGLKRPQKTWYLAPEMRILPPED